MVEKLTNFSFWWGRFAFISGTVKKWSNCKLKVNQRPVKPGNRAPKLIFPVQRWMVNSPTQLERSPVLDNFQPFVKTSQTIPRPQSTVPYDQVVYIQDCFQQPSVQLSNEKRYVQYVTKSVAVRRRLWGNLQGYVDFGYQQEGYPFFKEMIYSFILVGYCSCEAKRDVFN